MNLEKEVESIVLAMWDEPEEEMAREVMARFDISYDQARELVVFAIQEEICNTENYYEPDEQQEWYDFDPDC
jgi:hypothetical protein